MTALFIVLTAIAAYALGALTTHYKHVDSKKKLNETHEVELRKNWNDGWDLGNKSALADSMAVWEAYKKMFPKTDK